MVPRALQRAVDRRDAHVEHLGDLALLHYGVLDHAGAGLHNIWGMTSTTTDAALSLLVLAGWAILITAAVIRTLTRSAVN